MVQLVSGRSRSALLWAVAILLVAATTLISYGRLPDADEFSAVFFRRWMLLGMFTTGAVMAFLDWSRWWYWGVTVGLFPLVGVTLYMVVRGPGNIWPIALALAFAIGVVPAFVGAV